MTGIPATSGCAVLGLSCLSRSSVLRSTRASFRCARAVVEIRDRVLEYLHEITLADVGSFDWDGNQLDVRQLKAEEKLEALSN